MCGLFGAFSTTVVPLTRSQINHVLRMGARAQRRGSDASGILLVLDDGRQVIIKCRSSFQDLRSELVTNLKQLFSANVGVLAIFGHSRLETHGSSASHENNQPIWVDEWTAIHNGVITNHHQLRVDLLGDYILAETDTAVIPALLSKLVSDKPLTETMREVIELIEGEMTTIALSRKFKLLITTNVGNLYTNKEGTVLNISSEPRQFDRSLRNSTIQLKPGEILEFQLENGKKECLRTDLSRHKKTKVQDSIKSTKSNHQDAAKLMLRLHEKAQYKSESLQRCTNCLLPMTFPGIIFDSSGVCSVCKTFKKPLYEGEASLVNEIEINLAESQGKDVLVCLSGGRDSCYVLHMVSKLGFNPIAYTYDWGMVTTAARENMARLCGTIGCEHIVVSPNISENRKRVKQALTAWLNKPRLATLPILMAGDKPFFRYAAVLKHERGGIPAVMADHPLETTGFKSLLANARPNFVEQGGVSYRLDSKNILKLGLTYGAHGISNPALLPSILREGATGFTSYYLRPHKFIRPFSFVEWDENQIEETLVSDYGWSSTATGTSDNRPSWRMGDATSFFYNLSYFMGLGFTEHDTLRSNQIRFGWVTREKAKTLLAKDNQLVIEPILEYFSTLEVDPLFVLQRLGTTLDSIYQ